MQVSEVMHKGIITAQIDDSIRRVANLMKKENIGALPIYKNERPVGFVTDRDIVVSCIATGHGADEPISLAMSREIYSVSEKADVELAAKIMKDNQISRLLVIDEGERPVGMVSIADMARNTNTNLKADVLTEIKR